MNYLFIKIFFEEKSLYYFHKKLKIKKKTKKPPKNIFSGFFGWVFLGGFFYWQLCLDGGVEAGVLQRTVVDEHEAVPGYEAAVLLSHAPRHQRPDHDNRFLEQRERGLVNKLTNQFKTSRMAIWSSLYSERYYVGKYVPTHVF
jgi:hypothetical protein